jgi:NADH-quinone oxidoreductase subunit G
MSPQAETVTVTIDGIELAVPAGTLVIRAAEQVGVTIPRFCDHPLLDPVAACRQCLVEIEGMRKPMTACSTVVTDGMDVRTHLTSETAAVAQRAQLEFLLINHPLDCPQCDKGGECPLQDQALAHGPANSRFVDQKRSYVKPVAISPLIALDRERCVLCARCTRFAQQISGDPFIELFERGALEQVAIYEDDPYHSYFSGNIVQICPVGALTASTYRFRSRPFDLRSTSGVCNHCSAGCNLRVDTRRGHIQRQLAGENMAVNEMWNCDKGRFGFAWVDHEQRLRAPHTRGSWQRLHPTSWREALTDAGQGLGRVLEETGPQGVGVLSGGRLTDEDAYAVSRLARDGLGTDNVDFRLWPRTEEEGEVLAAVAGTRGPSYDDVENADVVVVAGLDPREEVPILHLRLRKAWRNRRQRIVAVGPALGSLAEVAWRWVATPAGDEARTLAALAGDAATGELAADVADALTGAGKVVVLAGERLARSPGALRAAARLATATGADFAWVPRRAGARGAVDAGLMPGVLPGGRRLDEPGAVARQWHRVPTEPGADARGILANAAAGGVRALLLVGVDPVRDFEDPRLAHAALAAAETVIAVDLMHTASTRYADVLLPAAAPQERVGSFTTWEGRRQPFPQAVPPQRLEQQDWDIAAQLARAVGVDFGWETAMDVRGEAAAVMDRDATTREGIVGLAPGDVALGQPAVAPPDSGELEAVTVDHLLSTRSTLLAGADDLLATAPTPMAVMAPGDAQQLGLTAGQDVTVTGPGGALTLPLAVSERVVAGSVVLPGNATDAPVGTLADPNDPTARLRVRLSKPAAELEESA